MSSPLPPDPYAALGVSKDADVAQIRTAHRKLVLKHHPDRIKGDDAEEKEKAKNEFQKVQQAYELLVDQTKRARYDDQIKLAELRKERMMQDASRPATQSSKSAPGAAYVRREMRKDGNVYEERAPPSSYFDDRDQFDDPLPRSSARKYDTPYEKERKPSTTKSTEKKEKVSSRAETPLEGISSRVRTALNAKAQRAREAAQRGDRDGHARNQEMKDRKERRERSEKHSSRRHVDLESGSDSDTVVPPHRPIPRSTRPSPRPDADSPHIRTRSPTSSRRGHHTDSESYDEDREKWERHHKNSMDYIAESNKNRPTMSRADSDAYYFWGAEISSGRRSGSDSERKPSSHRRTRTDDSRGRPSMPGYSSAPSNLRPFVEERAPERTPQPQRAKTSTHTSEREPRPNPALNRSQTMPVNKSSKKDNLPIRGSNLKQMETQDSGYYSQSPNMNGESPPPSRENSRKKGGNSTKYVVEDDDNISRVGRILQSDDERQHRRTKSPDQMGRTDRARPARGDSDGRPRPSKPSAPSSYSRAEFGERYKTSSSPRGSPSGHGRKPLYGEVTPDEQDSAHQWRYDTGSVKTSTHRPPMTTNYSSTRTRDAPEFSFSHEFREHPRNHMGRRPSAAH